MLESQRAGSSFALWLFLTNACSRPLARRLRSHGFPHPLRLLLLQLLQLLVRFQ